MIFPKFTKQTIIFPLKSGVNIITTQLTSHLLKSNIKVRIGIFMTCVILYIGCIISNYINEEMDENTTDNNYNEMFYFIF